MKIVERGLNMLRRLVRMLLFLLVLGMLAAVTMQVVGRYVFHRGFTWTDEFARYCLIYVSILGAVLVTQEKGHISVNVLDNILGGKAVCVLDVLRTLLSAAFGILVLSFTRETFETIQGSVSVVMHLPMEIIYAVYPVSFGAMLLYQLFGLVRDILACCGRDVSGEGDAE